MAAGAAAQAGLNAFGKTMGILQSVDEAGRRAKIFERDEQDYARRLAEHTEDRGRLHAMQDVQAEQQTTRFDNELEDRSIRNQRGKVSDAREAELFPLQKRMLELQQSGAVTQNALNQAQLKREQQSVKNTEAQSIVREAEQRLNSGDHKGAAAIYKKLADYGFDVDDLSGKGPENVQKVMDDLINGDANFTDKLTQQVVTKLMQPAFIQSGRDPKLFEIAGADLNEESGMVIPLLRNLSTGDIVPATDGMSAENGDPISGVPVTDLVDLATQYIGLGANIAATDVKKAINAKKAKFGMGAKAMKPGDALKQLELNEKLAIPDDQQQWDALIESYPDGSTERSIIMNMAADQDNRGDAGMAAEKVATVQRLAETESQKQDRDISVQEAAQIHEEREEIQAEISDQVQRQLQRHPVLEAAAVHGAIEKLFKSKKTIDSVRINETINKLADKATAKKRKREQKKKAQAVRDARPLMHRGMLMEVQ